MTVVCPSVCPVPDPKSRMDGHSKLKFGRKDCDHDPILEWKDKGQGYQAA